MKKIFRFIVLLVIIAALGAGAAYAWYQNGITSKNSSSDDIVTFTIELNSSLDTIAENLYSEGLISDKIIFTIYGKLNPTLVRGIEAGAFNISKNLTIPEVFAILQKAQNPEDIKVTIPEGLRYDEVITIVARAFKDSSKFSETEMTDMVENPDDFTFSTKIQGYLDEYKPAGKNLEGFLYPDTYLFSKDATAKEIIERLIGTLFIKVSAEDLNKVKSGNYSFYEILIVASMLERETITIEEQPMVADIMYKRIEHGINGDGVKLLQIDATLAYPHKDWNYFKTHNFNIDRDTDGPYNTYKRPGLPPTPIANPGITTIRAAIYPTPNEYYFYIHDNNGVIHYAKTLAEHERNIAQYL